MSDLLNAVRDYGISQSLWRKPSLATPAGAPPCWLEPREGVPAPGEGQNAIEVGVDIVAGVFISGGASFGRHNSFRRIDFLSVWVRCRKSELIWDFNATMRALFDDKRSWTMGGLYIMESLVFRDVQRLGADTQGWTFVTEFSFETLTQ